MITKRLKRNVCRGFIATLTLFAAMVFLLPACENDDKNNSPIDTGDDETTITFSVSVPNGFTPTSYGFSKNDEEYLSTVDVLLFNGTTFVSGPHYGVINGSNVTVRIPDTDGDYTMAVFGNCRSTINGKTFAGKTKTTIYGDLTVNNSAKWNTTVTEQVPASPIPMWGEANVTVNDGAVSGTVSVSLVRMLARINVKNSADNFKLTKVFVYNYNKNGRVAPADGKVTITAGSPPTITVSGISLPTSLDKETGTANPLEYTVTNGTKNYEFNNEIYLFEADVKTPAANQKPCLVIGGEYSGGSTTYYRVDLADATGGTLSYHDLYRNYSYNVAITNISGAGAATAAAAFNTTPINIQYEVTKWNDSDITQVVAGGTTLGVSQGEFNFTKGAANATLTVNTNNADGWTAKVFDSNGTTEKTSDTGFWLQITPKSNNSAGNTDVTLTVAANGSSTRTAFIEITAGTIVYTVKVVQSDSDISLLIDGSVSNKEIILVAPVGQSATKSFTLSWAPGTSPVYYSGSGSISNFTFGGSSISGGQVLSSNGQKVIEVQSPTFSGGTPTLSTPLVDGATASVSYLLYGLSRTVTLKQQVWDMFVTDGTNLFPDGSIDKISRYEVDAYTTSVTLKAPSGSTYPTPTKSNVGISGSGPTYTITAPPPTAPTAASPSSTITDNITFKAAYLSNTVSKAISFKHEVWDLFVYGSRDAAITYPQLPTLPVTSTPTPFDVAINFPKNSTITKPTQSYVAYKNGTGDQSTGSMTYTVSPPVGTTGTSLSSSKPSETRNIDLVFKANYGGNDVEKTLSVKQEFWNIYLSTETLDFGITPINQISDTKQLILYAPKDATVSWSVSNYGSPAISGLSYFSGLPTGNETMTGTSKTYNIQHIAESSVVDRTIKLLCTVSYGGKALTKTLTINQKTEDPVKYFNITSPTLGLDYYLLNSSGITINFDTNVPWKVTFTPTVINGSGTLSIDKTSGSAGAGQSVKITGSTTALGGTVELVFASQTSGQFADVEVPLPFAGTKVGNPSNITWAGTNIYYDVNKGHLTFDSGNTNQAYQGVFFQWGSLWGLSATGGTTVYKPDGSTSTATWSTIPRVTTSITSDESNNYLYYRTDAITGTGAAKGDICRWLTLKNWAPAGDWRMPTSNELRTFTGTASASSGDVANAVSAGTGTVAVGLSGNSVWLPAAGYRGYNLGDLNNAGSYGYYWSASPNSTYAWRLRFNPSTSMSNVNRSDGYSVRCVKDN